MSTSIDRAIEALELAADYIRTIKDIKNVSVDNDHKSGEIIFEANGVSWILKLYCLEPEKL